MKTALDWWALFACLLLNLGIAEVAQGDNEVAQEDKEIQRLALLPLNRDDPAGQIVSALVENALNEFGVILLERSEIDRILQEKELSVALSQEHWQELRSLLPADIFGFLDTTLPSKGSVPASDGLLSKVSARIRLVNTRNGVVFFSAVSEFDLTDSTSSAESAFRIGRELAQSILTQGPGAQQRSLYVAVTQILNDDLVRQWDWVGESLRAALEHRLGRSDRLVVLERQQVRDLVDETDFFHSVPAALLASSFLVSGNCRVVEDSGQPVIVATLVIRQGGKIVGRSRAQGPLAQQSQVADELAEQLAAQLTDFPAISRELPEKEAEQVFQEADLYYRFDRDRSLRLLQAAAALAPERTDIQLRLAGRDRNWFRRLAIAEHFLAAPSYVDADYNGCPLPNFSRLIEAVRISPSPISHMSEEETQEYEGLIKDFFWRYYERIRGECALNEAALLNVATVYPDILANTEAEFLDLAEWALLEGIALYRSGRSIHLPLLLEIVAESLAPGTYFGQDGRKLLSRRGYERFLAKHATSDEALVRFYSRIAAARYHFIFGEPEMDAIEAREAIRIMEEEAWPDLIKHARGVNSAFRGLSYRLFDGPRDPKSVSFFANVWRRVFDQALASPGSDPVSVNSVGEIAEFYARAADDPETNFMLVQARLDFARTNPDPRVKIESIKSAHDRLLREHPKLASASKLDIPRRDPAPQFLATLLFSRNDLAKHGNLSTRDGPIRFWNVYNWNGKPALVFTQGDLHQNVRLGIVVLNARTQEMERVYFLDHPIPVPSLGPNFYGVFIQNGPLFAADSQHAYLGISGAGLAVFPAIGTPFLVNENSGLRNTTFRQMAALDGKLYFLGGNQASGLLEFNVSGRVSREVFSDRRLHSEDLLDGRPLRALVSDASRERLFIEAGPHLLHSRASSHSQFFFYNPETGLTRASRDHQLAGLSGMLDGEEKFLWMAGHEDKVLVTAHPLLIETDLAAETSTVLVSTRGDVPANWNIREGWGQGIARHNRDLLVQADHGVFYYLDGHSSPYRFGAKIEDRETSQRLFFHRATSIHGVLFGIRDDQLFRVRLIRPPQAQP